MLKRLIGIFKSDELKGRFARGGIVLSGASAFDMAFRVLRNVILARLLVPECFGLMATITAVIALLQAVTEVGARQAVIQNPRGGTPEFLNVTFWFSAARGLLLFAAAYAAAPLICDFYDKVPREQLLNPLRVAFAALIFNGIVSPRIHVLEKELSYLKWVLMKQGSAVIAVSLAIVTAFFMKNVWPLVIGLVAEFAGTCLLSYAFIPFRPTLRIDRARLGELIRYARGMFGLPVMTSIFFQFDVIAIGKFMSASALGLYSLPRAFALVPVLAFSKTVRPLVLPTFSKLQDDLKALRGALMRVTDLVVAAVIPFAAFCIVFSRPLLNLLYGQEYGTVWLSFSILVFYMVFRLLSTILMQMYLALARPDLQRYFSLARLVVVLLLVWPAAVFFGMPGVAATVAMGMLSLLLLQLIYAVRLVDLKPRLYIRRILKGLKYSAFVVLGGIPLRILLKDYDIIAVASGVVLCFLVWLAAAMSPYYQEVIFGKGPGKRLS